MKTIYTGFDLAIELAEIATVGILSLLLALPGFIITVLVRSINKDH